MDEEKKQFSSPQEEIEYWKRLAHEYKQSYEDSKEELDEYQISSREFEAELEAQLEQAEAKMKDLTATNCRLQMDVESLRERLEQIQGSAHKQVTDMEDELAKVTCFRDELQKYIRELEQANDDLERAKRTTVVSLEDFEVRLNHAIERNAFLESELDEKETLAFTVQRLKDEARDLRSELAVVKRSESQPLIKGSGGGGSGGSDLPSPPSMPALQIQAPSSLADKVAPAIPELELDSNRLSEEKEGLHMVAPPAVVTPATPIRNKADLIHQSQTPIGGTASPLTSSARISALNIVGDLLRKVGALESKLASCRNFVHNQQPRSLKMPASSSTAVGAGSSSSPVNSPRAKRLHRGAPGPSQGPPPHPAPSSQPPLPQPQQPNMVKITI